MAVHERVIAAGADCVNGGTGVRFEVEGNGRMIAAFAIRYDGRVPAYANACSHQVL
jgi:nitrite reductase/ring-hydroxylating ferredoxin subunit